MRILTVGGGSGGHVTPVAAVIAELRTIDTSAEIRFWCDSKFYEQAKAALNGADKNVKVEAIASGKLRRYHGVPIWQQLLTLRTIVLPNIIDSFKIIVGVVQSIFKLIVWRPDVVFTKGGFVCLPVGLAAKVLAIPLVIHDSDAHPGLTNRLLSRFATTIATGAPLEYYPYPQKKTHYIGIPVAAELKPYTHEQKLAAKRLLGISEHEPLVVITGGGLGAKSINDALIKVLPDLCAFTSVILIAGKGNLEQVRLATTAYSADLFQAHGYVVGETMVQMLGAADIVVARAGATTLLELAALAKPAIIVPNEYLTAGHQLKNAKVYADKKAAIILSDETLITSPVSLVDVINATLLNKDQLATLSKNIHRFAKPLASRDMARLILEAARK